MKNGLYALASLDDAPLDPLDCQVMGLVSPVDAQTRCVDALTVRAVDRSTHSRAIEFVVRDHCLVALLGYLDEPAELACRLGWPPGTASAELALAALERFGDQAPANMLGEWSLLHWHRTGRELTLLASEAYRDPMFFATDGRRVAVSPELRRLSRLKWVGNVFDPTGLPMQLSRARLRRTMTGETLLLGARRVVPGTREVFGQNQRHSSSVQTPTQPDAWQGCCDDAVADLEAVLRRILRQNLERQGTAAFLLSGGLDSSLLGWMAAQERREDQQMFFLSSVAPMGSEIPDEREFSQVVAETLNLPIAFVCPDDSVSVFTPSARMFSVVELPVVSPRHYLYDALYDAALDGGAHAIFDGVYGELTLTSPSHLTSSANKPLRQRVRDGRMWLRTQIERWGWPANGFHARFSKDRLASLPLAWAHEWRSAYEPNPHPRPHEPWGFRPAILKNAMTPTTSVFPSLRHLMPFRDRRLLRLAAAMPASFLNQGGMNRALGRAMLTDRLPDFIRLRKSGRPFSPDYFRRIQRQALWPLDRIALYRAAGADDWLDLDWLAVALVDLSKRGTTNHPDVFTIQMTAVAAEFFVWWKGDDDH